MYLHMRQTSKSYRFYIEKVRPCNELIEILLKFSIIIQVTPKETKNAFRTNRRVQIVTS